MRDLRSRNLTTVTAALPRLLDGWIRDEIFFDRIRNRIRSEGFRSEYSTSSIVSVSEYLNRIFIISISNHILSDMVDCIHI